MTKLDKFLGESRQRFLTDAIAELQKLTATKGDRGTELSKNKFKLCIGLVKAQNLDRQQQTGFFDTDHERALDELRENTNLKWLFESVNRTLSQSEDEGSRYGRDDRIVYDRNNDRSR